MNTLDTKRQRAANAALLTLMQQQLPQNPFGEYLLALAESDLGQEGLSEAMPVPLLSAPLLPAVEAPDAPVETTPEPPPYSGDAAPGGATSGDTSATASPRQKRTYTRKPKRPEASASASPAPAIVAPAPIPVTPEQAEDFNGREAARLYVEECLQTRTGVNRTLVGQYLGTNLAADIQKFVVATQDAYRERNNLGTNLTPRKVTPIIEDGFARLAKAIHGDEDDEEEPSEAELRAMERSSAPKPPQAAKSEKMPSWWTPENQKRCERCGEVIQPTRFGAKQYCQSFAHYQARVYCSRQCAHNNSAWKAKMPGGKKG